ncbi:hypothetical protein [Sinorhizobium fredii]|uniref:hypothetical protein n=1 Tax=Rhizobium fredii TaxID=380 RepID=UPI0011D1A39F|nr:hypothetical protein [Sinorhizobium fredii]
MEARIVAAALVFLSPAAGAWAAPKKTPWDPNCAPVHRAFRATFSAERLSAVTYEVKPDGSLKAFREARFTDAAVFERSLSSPGNRWIVSRRGGWSPWEEFGPRYSGCKLVPGNDPASPSGSRYTTYWHGFPYEADAEIWLSEGDETVAKVFRRYGNSNWQFPFPNAVIVYNLDPASAAEPPGVALPE